MKIMMKRILFGGLVVAGFGAVAAFALPGKNQMVQDKPMATEKVAVNAVQWMTWDEAMKAMEKQPKKVFIDMYTDWCGWCKRMDQTTFSDPKVIEVMNKNFYNVKFDAEGKENVTYDGHTFKFIASGNRGVHELAYALLDGRLGYPSYVYLNEKRERITISPGYKPVDPFLKELSFITGEHYKTTSFQEYMNK